MADNMISPGVYSQIFSLRSYLSATPGTIGFVPIITEKGKDNVLYRCTGTDDFLQNFGEPDIRTFGKYYGCGPYIATQHLSVSNDLYVVRCLPDDATYAHTYIYFAKKDMFPYAYKFAQRFADVICDEGQTKKVQLFKIDKSASKVQKAIAEGTAYDNGLDVDGKSYDQPQPTNKAVNAYYTSDSDLADPSSIVGGTKIYEFDLDRSFYTNPDATTDDQAAAALTDEEKATLPEEGSEGYEDAYSALISNKKAQLDAAAEAEAREVAAAELNNWRLSIIAAGKAYDSQKKLIPIDTEETDGIIVYTSDTSAAAKETGTNVPKPAGYAWDEFAKFSTITVRYMEPTSSSGDGDEGYTKIYNSSYWYVDQINCLNAFSVEPEKEYAVQSDVKCFLQTSKEVDLYVLPEDLDDDVKKEMLARRIGFDKNGLLALNSIDEIEYTSVPHINEITGSDSDIDVLDLEAADVKGKQPLWQIDYEPWYVVKNDKKVDAATDYDGYDENGFLTTDSSKVVFCGTAQYAQVIKDENGDDVTVRQSKVALRKPYTRKFRVGGPESDGYLYKMDRVTNGWEKNAYDAIRECAAWDKNGYPALTVDKVYVTSIEKYAVTAKTPKMSTTQLLESLFYGNDTITLAMIKNSSDEGKVDIYNEKGRLPSNCILGYIRPVGRGDYYNDYSIKIVSDANPANFGTYKFQVFELQDGAEALAESFNVSFDPTALDGDGESLYFADVINKFSTRIVVEANPNAVDLFKNLIADFYKNDPTLVGIADEYTYIGKNQNEQDVELNLIGEFPEVDIPKYDTETGLVINAKKPSEYYDEDGIPHNVFGQKAKLMWEAYYAKAWAEKATADAAKQYDEALKALNSGTDENADAKLSLAIDAMNTAQDMTSTAAEIYAWATAQNLMNLSDSDDIAAGSQPYYLQYGTLGSLIDKKGRVNAAIGNQILSYGYTGLLKNPVVQKSVDESTGMIKFKQQYTDNVYDIDWIYFSIVYDPGYKPDVKQAALDLVDTYRRDCVLISDCGDNADYEECLKYVGAIKGAADAHMWNTYLAARYEPYSRIYDKFTGKDIWVSPVYHMAQMIPQNDALYNLWYASAGFNRGTVAEIKELRYSPNKSMRDQLYLAQVNPIVHFPEGMTVWGMLTTQKKNDALSDLPAVRTVLYIKRALEQYCRNFIFEFNDSTTWSEIQSNCSSFLSQIQSAGGIEDYSIDVGATDYELKTKTCHVNVTLTMRKILEKIKLNFYVQ